MLSHPAGKNILFGMLLVAVMTPLVISNKLLFLYIGPKVLAFEALVLVATILWIFLWYRDPDTFSPQCSILAFAVGIYVTVSIIAAWQGVNFWRSFYSTFERMDGIFIWIVLFLFFLLLRVCCRRKNDWVWLLRISFFTSMVVCLKAMNLLDFFGAILPAFLRVQGVFGNPLFIAIYALSHIAMGFLLFFLTNPRLSSFKDVASLLIKPWSVVYALGIILNALVFFLADEKGPIIGFFLGVIFFIGWYWMNGKKKDIAVKFFAVILILLLFLTPFLKVGSIIKRFSVLGSSALEDRRINWGMAFQAFLAKPVLGWGPNNYYIAQNYFYNPHLFGITTESFDRPHNKYLEVAVDAGMLGLISYISIFGVVFFYLFKARKKEPFLTALIAGFFFAYLLQNATFFDSPGSYMPLFLFLGFVDATFLPSALYLSVKPRPWLVACCLLLVVALFWQGIWRFYSASAAFQRAVFAQNEKRRNYRKILENYKEGFSYRNFDIYTARISLGKFLLGATEFSPELFDFSVSELEDEIRHQKQEVAPLIILARLYEGKARVENNPQYAKRAQDLLGQAIALSPHRPEIYETYAAFFLDQGKGAKVRLALSRLRELDEAVFESLKDQWYLGSSYFIQGDFDKARQLFQHILAVYAPKRNLLELRNLSSKVKDYDTVNNWHTDGGLTKGTHDSAQYHLFLALAFNHLGDKKRALDEARYLIALHPNRNGELNEILALLD